MKVLFNLGLGDAIAVAPIIAKLAQENESVLLPCWKHNLVSVESFFIDHPNIAVVPFDTESEMLRWGFDAEIRLGFYGTSDKDPGEDFVQRFYRQAHFDMSEKEKYCPILKASKKYNQYDFGNDFNFIHDDYIRGFSINNFNGIKPFNDSQSILRHTNNLFKAKEIHCIDSSFLHLAEAVPTTGKLFYHKYARPNSTDYKYLKKEWTVIE